MYYISLPESIGKENLENPVVIFHLPLTILIRLKWYDAFEYTVYRLYRGNRQLKYFIEILLRVIHSRKRPWYMWWIRVIHTEDFEFLLNACWLSIASGLVVGKYYSKACSDTIKIRALLSFVAFLRSLCSFSGTYVDIESYRCQHSLIITLKKNNPKALMQK